jgi:hypothetical protein
MGANGDGGEDSPLTSETIRGLLASELAAHLAEREEDSAIQSIRETQHESRKKVDALADLFLDQAKAAKTRRKLLTWVAGMVATLGGGSFAGYEVLKAPAPLEVVPADVEATVIEHSDALDARVEHVEEDISDLREAAIEQQIQIVDGIEFISEKIDAAHPDEADAVAAPASLLKARRKTARAKAERELFDGDG